MKHNLLLRKQSSVVVAKDRLHNLLTCDRVRCTPELTQQMQQDIYAAVSKYMEIKPDTFEFKLTRTDIHIRFAGDK